MAIPSTQIQPPVPAPAPAPVPSILKPPAATDTGLDKGGLSMGIQGPPLSPPTTAGPGATLHQAIQFAKANPSSDYAKRLGGLIVSGKADDRAMKEGVDLSFAGRPSLKTMYQKHIELNGGTPPEAGSPIEHFQQGFLDLINKAGDATVKQQQEGGQKMISSVTEGADKLGAPENADMAHEGLINAETALGTASGAVQTLFAPITGIIQAISDKASDSKAVQDFANGVGPLVDLYDQLDKKINEVATAHPEAAKVIGDAANVLLSTMGGETGAGKGALEGDVGAAGGKVSESFGSAATDVKNAAGDIKQAATELPARIGEAASKIPRKIANVSGPGKEIAGSMGNTALEKVFGMPLDTINFLKANPHFSTPEILKAADIEEIAKEVEQNYAVKQMYIPQRSHIAEEVQNAVHAKRPDVPTVQEITNDIEQGLQKKMQALNEHAKQYSTLGNNSKPGAPRRIVKVQPNWLKTQIENAGVTFGKDGRAEFKSSSDKVHAVNVTDTPRGAQIMQNLWDEYGPKFAKGEMSRDTFLKFRQSLAQLANYQGGVDTTLERAAHGIRDRFNSTYRKQLPGLDKVDAEHSRLSKDFTDSLTGLATEDKSAGLSKVKMNEGAIGNIINADKATRANLASRIENIAPGTIKKIEKLNAFNKEWSGILDEHGNLTENAINKMASATAPGKDILLAKLEKAVPGVGAKINQMKKFEKDWQDIFDQHGRLTDNARSKIQNAINEGRQPRLERLKSLVLDIETKLDTLKAKHDIYGSGNKPGTYAKNVVLGGATATGNIPLIFASLASQSPTVMLKILQKLGEFSGRKKI